MITITDINVLDSKDPLKDKKQGFSIPPGLVYLDGNSLGALPSGVQNAMTTAVETEWGKDLISSWNTHNWIDLPLSVGDKIGAIIGAAPGQVVCCDSISVNLVKVLSAALALRPGRSVILSQHDNFPTDLYMAEGLTALLGESRCRLKTVDADDIVEEINESVAVVMLTHVNFRTGALHDMAKLTEAAHRVGALVVWDLAHSAGALPLALDELNVDFAVGCGYKYLNGGPGAPAFIYAARKHLANIHQPICGWMGHANPFAFEPGYQPAKDIKVFLAGTPNILSMKALDAALDAFDNVDMNTLRQKSLALSDTFLRCIQQDPCLSQLQCVSPVYHKERGSQLAFRHPHAYAIVQALIEDKVVADFRAPDLVRFGFTPLYLSYEDIWTAADRLSEVMASEKYLAPRFQTRNKVT